MKKLMPYLLVAVIIAAIVTIFLSRAQTQQMVTVVTGNHEKKPLPIIFDHYQDTMCGMPVKHLQDAAQAIAPDGKTWFFDDIGCLTLWMQHQTFKDKLVIWVYAKDTKEWIDAQRAFYTLTDTTPMHYGFGAYRHKRDGMINFEEVRLKMLRGEHLNNPYTRRELLGEH
jgi:copper chaperone NosL